MYFLILQASGECVSVFAISSLFLRPKLFLDKDLGGETTGPSVQPAGSGNQTPQERASDSGPRALTMVQADLGLPTPMPAGQAVGQWAARPPPSGPVAPPSPPHPPRLPADRSTPVPSPALSMASSFHLQPSPPPQACFPPEVPSGLASGSSLSPRQHLPCCLLAPVCSLATLWLPEGTTVLYFTDP